MNLVLGTATLGLPCGICNWVGKLGQREVTEIVETAWGLGIKEFDTAQAYQDSEAFLGGAFRDLNIRDKVKVITKLDPKIDVLDKRQVFKGILSSRSGLGTTIYGLLLHWEHLLDSWDSGLSDVASWIVDEGWAEKFGVSVYKPEYALKAMGMEGIEIVQFPSNVMDRRFEKVGVFEDSLKKRVEVYVRNVFLQGLLLKDPEEVSLEIIRPELGKLQGLARRWSLNAIDLVVGYLRASFPHAKLIFGAETSTQVREVVAAWKNPFPFKLQEEVRRVFSDVSDDVLIPKRWRRE